MALVFLLNKKTTDHAGESIIRCQNFYQVFRLRAPVFQAGAVQELYRIGVTAVRPKIIPDWSKAATGELEVQIILPEKCLERPASPSPRKSTEQLSFGGLFSGRSSAEGLPRQRCK